MNNIFETIGLSLGAGILPALIWLWFWLHEDRKHPEPLSRVVLAFLGGMGAVILAIPLEQGVIHDLNSTHQLITVWAAIEELLKFGMVYFIALRSRSNDEPL